MKKIVLITLISLFISGCSPNTEVVNKIEPVNAVKEESSNDLKDVQLDYPLCKDIYKTENFSKEILIDTFSPFMPTKYFIKSLNDDINALFNHDEFNKLVSNSELFTFCFYDSHTILFSFYDGARTNVAGIYSTQSNGVIKSTYITDTKPFRPQGDLYGCKINGFIENTMYYTCGSGDGCGGTEQIYSLNLNGETKTLKDCDYGCTIKGYEDGNPVIAENDEYIDTQIEFDGNEVRCRKYTLNNL